MNDRHHVSPQVGSHPGAIDPALERRLDEWGRRFRERDAAGDDLADRVFAASRAAIAARRSARTSAIPLRTAGPAIGAGRERRLSAWRAPMLARFALAAGVLAALLIPATLDLGGGGSPPAGLVVDASTTFEATASLGGGSASEPLLLALIEPDAATWEDVAGHEPGVDLYAVLESGRAGLDDYLSELDAIFGTLGGAGEEM